MSKTVLRILLFVLLAAGSASAQNSKWVVANDNVGAQMNFMSFPSHDVGYFAGVGSVPFVMTTPDSGHDVNSLKLPSNIAVSGNSVLDMSWPTTTTGYLSTANGLVKTLDGGKTWKVVYTDAILKLATVCFPSANVGYATGVRGDSDTKFFIAKTVDGGNTWTKVYQTLLQTNTGKIYFKDDTHGMFFGSDLTTTKEYIIYTTDGMATATLTSELKGFGSLPWFLNWNSDDSWNVGYQGIQRSVDFGKTWTYTWDKSKDSTGDVITGCYGGKRGFAFTEMWSHVLESTDYGATYSAAVLPDSIGPVASAFTPTAAYVLGVDFTGNDVLLRTDIAAPSSNGGVSWDVAQTTPFAVYVDGQQLTFTSQAAASARMIEVMDVLGRNCASVAIASNSEMAHLNRSALRPGTYFAKLGNASTKFTITN